MNLVNKDDIILKTPTQKFDFVNPPFDPIEFAKNLIRIMYDNNGIGLAANQIGVPYSIFAMRASPENFVCFNPKIIDTSQTQIVLEEGCLTYPGIVVKIKRPQHIRVRFNTPNGDTLTKKFTGMTARIFQHEYEHLQGGRFFDSLSSLKKEMLIKKTNKKGHSYIMKDLQ
jgi:peptide deformylase